MKNIIQAIKDCHSARINCCACGAGERVYFIPESIISKLEVAVAKIETTTSTCKDSLQVGDMAKMRDALAVVLAVKGAIELQRKPGRKIVCGEDATIFRCLDAVAEAQKIMQTIGKAG
jgi:hypothetical protein